MGRNVIPKNTIPGNIILRNVISYLKTNTNHFKRHAAIYTFCFFLFGYYCFIRFLVLKFINLLMRQFSKILFCYKISCNYIHIYSKLK